jgi:undecaprenyl-diphosphatase
MSMVAASAPLLVVKVVWVRYNLWMTILEAVLLGFVQGFTEFLPISSSGHLVLARAIFDIDIEYALAFDAILHLATVAAVGLYFYQDILTLVQTVLRKLGRLPVNERDETLLYALLAGTVPVVIVGLTVESYVEKAFLSPLIVAGVMIVAAVFFMYAEWRQSVEPRRTEMSVSKGLKIGLFQVIAILPGFSRSGATLAGGMLLGLTRSEAARFSFLLAMPVTAGVGIKKLLEFIVSDQTVAWVPMLVGAMTATITAFIVIHFFLAFIRRYSLWPFIWYTLILGCFVLFIFWLG